MVIVALAADDIRWLDSACAMLSPPDLRERGHPPARRLLAGALEALGGEGRVAALDDWLVEGRGRENLSAELQGLSPDECLNRFFARWLETRGLAPRAVYGVHYAGAAGPEALSRAAR